MRGSPRSLVVAAMRKWRAGTASAPTILSRDTSPTVRPAPLLRSTSLWLSRARLGTFFSDLRSVVIARLMSTAGTGYMYTTRRLRVMERLSMMKYDPIGMSRPTDAVKRHVLFKEVKGKK